MRNLLEHKTIFITGSSRGIGLATAELLQTAGANIILHGKTESPHLSEAAHRLQCPSVFGDVSKEEEIEALHVQLLTITKHLDGLVNNAGVALHKNLKNSLAAEWRYTLDVDLFGPAFVSKALQPMMQPGSAIVNMCSMRALDPLANNPAYSAAKAGLQNLTASMAKEFSPHIRVNAVAPGIIKTAMIANRTQQELDAQIQKTLLQSIGSPLDVAKVILFLLSDMSGYITGQIITVDGGYSLGLT